MAKTLLEQIREAHKEGLLAGLLEGGFREGTEAGGKAAGGGGGEEAISASAGSGGNAASSSAWYEADALALVPFFSEQASSIAGGEMNFLNKTSGAMSLAADVAGIANSIGQGGNLAGFLRDLGHTCCSNPASLRQAIRVRRRKQGLRHACHEASSSFPEKAGLNVGLILIDYFHPGTVQPGERLGILRELRGCPSRERIVLRPLDFGL